MLRRQHTLALVCLFISSLMISCGSFHHKKKKKKASSEYLYVHGDPLSLIEDAELNKSSFLKVDDLKKFDGFVWGLARHFVEKEMIKRAPPLSQTELEEQNSTSKVDREKQLEDIQNYEFRRTFDGYSFEPVTFGDDDLTFNFEEEGGVLELKSIFRDHYPVEVLHYSHNATMMSFLVTYESRTYGKTLLSTIFYKPDEKFAAFTKTDTENDYVLGAGVRAVWAEEIRPTVCEKDEEKRALLVKGITDWADNDGTLAGHKFSINTPKTFPPFSDVNTFCVQFGPVYSENEGLLGVATRLIDAHTRHYLHSQVFVYDKVHEDIAERHKDFDASSHLLATIKHEFGHFFGLGHEFDRNSLGELLHASIMGYGGVLAITDWDRKVAKDLYHGIAAIVARRKLASNLCKDNALKDGIARHNAYNIFEADGSCAQATYNVLSNATLALDFSYTTLQTLAHLTSLTGLKSLDLTGTEVADLAPLANHPTLHELKMSHSKVADLKPIANNEKLMVVDYTPSPALGQKITGCDADIKSPGVKDLCEKLKLAGAAL